MNVEYLYCAGLYKEYIFDNMFSKVSHNIKTPMLCFL